MFSEGKTVERQDSNDVHVSIGEGNETVLAFTQPTPWEGITHYCRIYEIREELKGISY